MKRKIFAEKYKNYLKNFNLEKNLIFILIFFLNINYVSFQIALATYMLLKYENFGFFFKIGKLKR